MKNTKIKTLSKETVIKWKWAGSSGSVYYNITTLKGETERRWRCDRICHIWGLAKRGPFVDAWANEEWIYIRRGSKEYRTPLH